MRIAIIAEVRDSVSGEAAAAGALLTVQEGVFRDTVRGDARLAQESPPYPFLQWIPQRPGTYDVTIEKAGYKPWVRRGLQIRRQDCCSVWTAELDAQLVPLR